MIAYNFQSQFGPHVATGAPTPKTLTLRRERKAPSRHARVGEPIGLWTGLRTSAALRRGVGLVTLRATLLFHQHGIVAAAELVVHDGGDDAASALQDEIEHFEVDAFARRDGFENWSALWGWHDKNRADAEKGALCLSRQLIAWRPLTQAAIATLDAGGTLEAA